MKLRFVGVVLVIGALAYAGSVFAFSRANVTSSGTVSITASNQLVALSASSDPDNAGVFSQAANGIVTLDLGSNGTTSPGIQGNAQYAYDYAVLVTNNGGTSKDFIPDIDPATPLPTGLTVEMAWVAATGLNTCPAGTPSYVSPGSLSPVTLAASAQACLSIRVATDNSVTAGAKNFGIRVHTTTLP